MTTSNTTATSYTLSDATRARFDREVAKYPYELRQSAVNAVKPGQPKPNFVPVGFTISVQGELPALLRFLTLVESGTRFARVMGASCGVPPTDRAALVTLTLNLELLGQP